MALGALVRSRNLTLPPVDYHSWRQVETADYARNYYEEGYRLFYPTVSRRGHTPGYIESELSLYAFAAAVGYGLFGFHEAIPRLLTIATSTATGYVLFLIGRRLWGSRAGLLAVLVFTFLSPFGLYFGQAIMGDMLVLLFVSLAIYAGLRWAEGGPGYWFGLAAILATLGALSKLPALYVGVPLASLVFQRDGWRALFRLRNWLAALGALAVVTAWYLHAFELGQQTGLSLGILSNNDRIGDLGLLRDPSFYQALFYNFSWRLLTATGVALWLLGMALPRQRRSEHAIYLWVGSVFLYFLIAARGVIRQDYYTLSLLPSAALFAGKALDFLYARVVAWARADSIERRLGALALLVGWGLALPWGAVQAGHSANEMFQPVDPKYGAWMAGQWAQAVVPVGEGLVAVGGAPPEGLYYSHRHGLYLSDLDLALAQEAELRKEGWRYLVIFNPYWGLAHPTRVLATHTRWRLIGGGDWFLAYDISQGPSGTPQDVFSQPPQWGEQVTLLGYDLIPGRPVNSKLYPILYWRAEGEFNGRYVGFVHVWDSRGAFCGQDDHPPLNGLWSTDQWKPGAVVADPFEIDVSGCAGDAHLELRVGMYLAATGERLPLSSQPSVDQLYRFTVRLLDVS
ncbi:MAG: glycosyltransferase family 39 protein [Chloroflexi bacterium]|nr:glycosyltransferase family 39 protein [Chloroflexota bacterium]